MSLPERPAFIHVLPVFDILGLLLVFVLLGSSFMVETGVEVELPRSSEQLQRYSNPIKLTLSAGNEPAAFLNGKRIAFDEIGPEIQTLLATSQWKEGDVVLLNADASLAYDLVSQATEVIKSQGMRCALGYRQSLD